MPPSCSARTVPVLVTLLDAEMKSRLVKQLKGLRAGSISSFEKLDNLTI